MKNQEKEYLLGGVHVGFKDTVYHWKGQGNSQIQPVELPFMNKTVNSKSYWSEEPVTVRNAFISVTVYPDGRIEQELHDQIKSRIETVHVKKEASEYTNKLVDNYKII